MKQISTILSVAALILVAILFVLFFTKEKPRTLANTSVRDSGNTGSFRIAYFDIDSLQSRYEYFKDAFNQMKSKENQMSAELTNLENSYQRKIREWQEKGPNMTQTEGEAAQREYGQMQQRYQRRKLELEQELEKHKVDLMSDLRKKVEDFLKEYNSDKRYAYILSYEPGFILYYKDSAYDITGDLIEGLNSKYKSKEVKKK
ncbi:MAG TPA: OmpH family outer membrane protein [Flavitalea sp.]|nr:OmpH family outer membrane protein [Flavitalea sp.]